MEWQAIVLVMQILMLAVGWFLFQQARGELSARAAETPVLGEVKALHRSIKQLLTDLEQTSEHASSQLETRCVEARHLIATLEDRFIEADRLQEAAVSAFPLSSPAVLAAAPGKETAVYAASYPSSQAVAAVSVPEPSVPTLPPNAEQEGRVQRRRRVFALADEGQTAAHIARETGSEGEIETLLGLRLQRT